MASLDPTQRFSDRVADYMRYRPGYPEELFTFFHDTLKLRPDDAVADLGAGTGILTRMFLDRGHRVYAIEPNPAMAEAAEATLGGRPGFVSVRAPAEDTGLEAGAVGFLIAGQAFHWFDALRASREARRILRPEGFAVLVWNDRQTTGTPFLEGYDRLLLRFGLDYARVSKTYKDPVQMAAFFGPRGYRHERFANNQRFDFDGLCGRLRSSSYAPPPGHAAFEPMMAALRGLFDAEQRDGTVEMSYHTEVFYGHLGS